MENFKQNNDERTMHKVVCSECGKDCEVPFKPTGDKPVFCNDCFKNRRQDAHGRFNSGNKKMYKAICDKCGKECEVPFKPTGDKPIYCNQCFSKVGKPHQAGSQFDIINAKLDKILEALRSSVSVEAGKKKHAQKDEIFKPKKVTKSKVKKVASTKKPKLKAKAKPKKKK